MKSTVTSLMGGVLLVLALLPTNAAVADEVDGVLSLYPVGSSTYLAVEITLAQGQSLSGLQWYNNDGTMAFPKLLLMEGSEGSPPDLAETGMILDEVTGESLSWGDVTLTQAVSSTTDRIYAVFLFPEGQEMTAEGAGGGPGIGYHNRDATHRSFISAGGSEWVQLSKKHDLAIAVSVGSAKTEARTLSSLKGSVDLSAIPREQEIAIPERTRLVSAAPNPFNPQTEIHFELKRPTHARLKVYNLRGQLVRPLLDRQLPAGAHSQIWDGRDLSGSSVASGVYMIQLEADGKLEQLRVTLVK
jgi:hypothetical protein